MTTEDKAETDRLHAEIDRLKAALEHEKAQFKIVLDSYADENQRFHDMNDRLRAGLWEEGHMNDSLRREIERLRAKLVIIHDIAQNTIEPCWQALQNICATAAGGLAEQGKG